MDPAGTTGLGGSCGLAGSCGVAGTTGMGMAGATGAAGAGGGESPGIGGVMGMGGVTAAGEGRQGPFRIIVLTTTIDFTHDSIPTCSTMLAELGKATAPERAKIVGLAPDSTWTVDLIGNDPKKPSYFSEVTADNLKKYELFYSNNPNGPVFSRAPSSAQRKQAFVDYWTNGGSWAGQHSATDFEKDGQWSWFQDNINGGWFVGHDDYPTNATLTWQPEFVDHPILRGLTTPRNSVDEWYVMNRNIEAVRGFQVIAKVTVPNSSKGTAPRPAVWITENPKGGRSFYTIWGHAQKVYAEPEFRELMLRGILWAVHRLPGGT